MVGEPRESASGGGWSVLVPQQDKVAISWCLACLKQFVFLHGAKCLQVVFVFVKRWLVTLFHFLVSETASFFTCLRWFLTNLSIALLYSIVNNNQPSRRFYKSRQNIFFYELYLFPEYCVILWECSEHFNLKKSKIYFLYSLSTKKSTVLIFVYIYRNRYHKKRKKISYPE